MAVPAPTETGLRDVRADIGTLMAALQDAEQQWSDWIEQVHPRHRRSAVNLAHYWGIRQTDLRELQSRLGSLGLSSLGRSEAHVQSTLVLVAAALDAMDGRPYPASTDAVVSTEEGDRILDENTAALLGPPPDSRSVHIMVTLPSKAADDPGLIADLVDNGMNVARINCAHDDAETWRAMAEHVRTAARKAGRTCVVAMDLAGPKLRTGPVQDNGKLKLQGGDTLTLTLTRELAPAEVKTDSPRIGCTLPEVFDNAEEGHRVFFDDRKLGGTIIEVGADELRVRIDSPALDKEISRGARASTCPTPRSRSPR